MKLKRGQSAAEAAQALLPKMARKYFEAGRDAVSEKRPPDELHQFRLRTKRFRYTLELFRPVYGVRLDPYLESLRTIQGALGKVSDYEAIRRVLGRDHSLDARIHAELKHKVKGLRQEWEALDSAGALKQWRAFLAGESPRSATPRKRPVSAKKSPSRKRA